MPRLARRVGARRKRTARSGDEREGRRGAAGGDQAVPIAASIFLDVLNVFQFFRLLFGGGSRN